MPGNAITDQFMLGTATVMIGPQADLYDLNPAEHSIGLVKNFTINSDPTYVELTQGVQNSIVHSTLNGNPVRATMETYEFSAQNLSYALCLEGADQVAPKTVETATAGATSAGANTLAVDSAAGIVDNDYIMIKVDNEDNFVIRQVTDVVTNTLTLNQALPVDVAADTPVILVNMISGGSKKNQPYYAAKIAGKLANGDEIVLLLPKLRIVRGFSLAFATDAYGNLPMEFTMYDQVSSDPFYADFGGNGGDQFRIFAQK